MHKNPTLLYLIYHKKMGAIKVGVNDIGNSRFASHRRMGWDIVDYWYFDNIGLAKKAEKLILNKFRQKSKMYNFLSKDQMPQGGYTETFPVSIINLRYAKMIINKIIHSMVQF